MNRRRFLENLSIHFGGTVLGHSIGNILSDHVIEPRPAGKFSTTLGKLGAAFGFATVFMNRKWLLPEEDQPSQKIEP